MILTMYRASIATIVRIPYVHTLGDAQDFLYSTTDVAIWSCSETGLAITASCGAVLRPLFRQVLSSSRHVSSRVMSRGKSHQHTSRDGTEKHVSAIRHNRRRSHSDGWGDEVPLHQLGQHGGASYKSDYTLGGVAKAWHCDGEER